MSTALFLGVLVMRTGIPAAPVLSPDEAEKRCWQEAHKLFAQAHPSEPVAEGRRRQMPPKLLRRVAPTYPDLPREASASACLRLRHEALIAPTGEVVALWTVRPDPGAGGCPAFEDAVAAAIRQWRYAPYRVGKRKVPLCLSVTTIVDVTSK